MKVAIGSDHAGYKLKEIIKTHLNNEQYEIIDYGTFSPESIDYPDYALQVAEAVKNEKVTYGILICYTGIGMSIAANKVVGVRAALVTSVENAKLTREHNDANIICLGAKDLDETLANLIVDEFLKTSFVGGRHKNRVNKIIEIEKKYGR